MHRTKKNILGFTLVEIVVSIAIVSFIAIAVVTFQISFLRSTATVQSGLIAQQQVRRAFYGFMQEVRTAVSSPSGSFALVETGTSSFTFYANNDSDVAIERIRYYIGTTTLASTTILYKEVIQPAGVVYLHANETLSILVNDIRFSTSTATFSYFDTNYAGTSTALTQPVTPTAVRLVKITLPIDPNAARSPVFQTYTTQVSIRNLKDNL